MEAWLEFARGPLFRLAIALFVLGLLRHVALTILAVREAIRKAGDKTLPTAQIRKATITWVFPTRPFAASPWFSGASVVAHVGMILAPLFLATHVLLVKAAIGIAWPTLPALISDLLTVGTVGGLAVLLFLRLATRRGIALSRSQDVWIIPVVGLPFVTGFLAMHPAVNPIPFEPMLLAHILSADLALAVVPFTKLVHVALLPATQLVSEVGWRFVPDAGEKVAEALEKENQPI